MPRIRYIKANPKVAEYLGLAGCRRREGDGNYILVTADIMPFGPVTEIGRLCAEYGMRVMSTEEMIREQNGLETYPLPEAQNANFRMPAEAEEAGDGGVTEPTEPTPEVTEPDEGEQPEQSDQTDPIAEPETAEATEAEPSEGADGV